MIQLVYELVVGDGVEGLAEVQDHHISLNMSFMVVSSWVSQEYSSLKLWFLSLNMLCFSRWSQRLTNDVFEQFASYRRQ